MFCTVGNGGRPRGENHARCVDRIFYFLGEPGIYSVGQAGLKLLATLLPQAEMTGCMPLHPFLQFLVSGGLVNSV